jgi:hypothetical protein
MEGQVLFTSFTQLCRSLSDEERGFEFAVQRGLIKQSGVCECGGDLVWGKKARQRWGFIFRCTKSRSACGKAYSILHGTWFARSNLPIHDQLLLTYCLCMELRSGQLETMLGISNHTAADWQSYFRDICVIYMSEVQCNKIGGVGYTIEIDETKVFRRKNHQGRLTAGEARPEWVFGGICRQTKQTFFCVVPDRSEDTLLRALVDNVHLGTEIMSDCWKSYRNLSMHGFIHSSVNHSKNFVSPENANVHTQTIERAWRGLKANIPKSAPYESRISHIAVYSFKMHVNWYGMSVDSRFELLLGLLARFY